MAEGTYGSEAEQWLQYVAGLAALPDRVVVYDGGSATLHVLDGDLRRIRTIGREGPGPNELSRHAPVLQGDHFSHQLLSLAGGSAYVHDGRAIKAFDLRTGEARHVARAPFAHGVHGLLQLHSGSRGQFAAVSWYHTDRKRRFTTYRVAGDSLVPVHVLPLSAPVYTETGRIYTDAWEARPIWAMHGGCLFAGDGSAPHLLRVDLDSGRTDTLRLPRIEIAGTWEVPEPIRKRMGIREGTRPTAPWRWANLVVDPDGHLWLNPVRPRPRSGGEQHEPITVYRLDPAGRVHEHRLPAFPLAFGRPGVFYTRLIDPATDESVVARFRLQQPER